MNEHTNKPYRVGVIGGGRQGTVHARAYAVHPRTEVVAVADTDSENLELFCARFQVPGYSSYKKMLQEESIEISAPVLPVRANPEAVIASAQAGVKAVFCEKPLAGSLHDADRMVEECSVRNIPFVGGLCARNYPDYWQARDLVENGEMGEVESINIYDTNGQGGCHGMNLARHFASDAEIDWVVGWVDGDASSDYEEDYGIGRGAFGGIGGYLKFSNGIEGFSHLTNRTPRLEVVCSRGIIYNENNTWNGLHLMKAPDGMKRWTFTDLQEVKDMLPAAYHVDRNYDDQGWRNTDQGIMDSISALVETLDNGTPLKTSTGDNLRKALEACLALRESARRGNSRVDLPLDDRTIKFYPQKRRWNYKKEIEGAQWYREQMTLLKPE